MATETETASLLHPEAVRHLPVFIALPGETDWFLVGTGLFLIAVIVGIGVFYLKLHALPEHMAHRGQKIQFEIVAVLCLIALFTHNHLFWIAGLLLAMIPLPDFSTPLISMARSLGRMSGTPVDEPESFGTPDLGPDTRSIDRPDTGYLGTPDVGPDTTSHDRPER